jgi:hypothetical protein
MKKGLLIARVRVGLLGDSRLSLNLFLLFFPVDNNLLGGLFPISAASSRQLTFDLRCLTSLYIKS